LFFNQGQCCCAGSRLYVHESIHDEFVAKLIDKARHQKLGDPFDPATTQGPQVSEVQMNRVLGYIEAGKKDGAELLTGGSRHGSTGYFVEPTIFGQVTEPMRIAQEEIFGPVMSVMKFRDASEVLSRANKNVYGLAAAVWTRDIKKALGTAHALKAGTVWVNCYDVFDACAPFGGYKMSGIGRELGEYALELYTQVKTVTIAMS